MLNRLLNAFRLVGKGIYKIIMFIISAYWIGVGLLVLIGIGAYIYDNETLRNFVGIPLIVLFSIFFIFWIIGSGYLEKGYHKIPLSIRRFLLGTTKVMGNLIKIIVGIILLLGTLWLTYHILMISPIFTIIVILIIIAFIIYNK